MIDLRKHHISYFQHMGLTLGEVETVIEAVAHINTATASFCVRQVKGRYVLFATWPGRWWQWSRAVLQLSEASVRILVAQSSQALPVTSPITATFLFYLFYDAKNCDALVGDLEERYRLIHKKFGTPRANFWYWTQALKSVVPIALAWGKKIVLKPIIGAIVWAIAKGLLGHDSWLAALVEILKKIRT